MNDKVNSAYQRWIDSDSDEDFYALQDAKREEAAEQEAAQSAHKARVVAERREALARRAV